MNTLNTSSPVPPNPTSENQLHVAAKGEFIIQDAAGWVLRVGVLLSVAVMILGLAISFIHTPPTVKEMRHAVFETNPVQLYQGVIHGSGKSIIDLGLLLLVLTPISRVAVSMVLFAVVEHDYFYTWITLAVLLLTLISLIFLH
ncbi:MAG: DUF1634 domain-containing protein [Planctomycetia bacterium]|jgi:uncharacterized membrane protein|nr:DUF1634 domain-containing protein [Planctomycetia bacterium]